MTENPAPLPPDDIADPSDRLSIDQLSTLAGLTPRTVRYYIQQGLVSRPEGAKRGAYYGRRHLEQLLLIRRWTDAGLSLDRVRELIAGAPEDPPPRPARPGTVEVWSRLTLADGLIRVGEELSGDERRFDTDRRSPIAAGCNTQNLMVYVDDVDAHCEQARAAGAHVVAEPELHDYGAEYWADRCYGAIDPEGHLWWFAQRIRG